MGMFLRRGKPESCTVLIGAAVSKGAPYNAYARARINGAVVTSETTFKMYPGDVVTIETQSHRNPDIEGVYRNDLNHKIGDVGTYLYTVKRNCTLTFDLKTYTNSTSGILAIGGYCLITEA